MGNRYFHYNIIVQNELLLKMIKYGPWLHPCHQWYKYAHHFVHSWRTMVWTNGSYKLKDLNNIDSKRVLSEITARVIICPNKEVRTLLYQGLSFISRWPTSCWMWSLDCVTSDGVSWVRIYQPFSRTFFCLFLFLDCVILKATQHLIGWTVQFS